MNEVERTSAWKSALHPARAMDMDLLRRNTFVVKRVFGIFVEVEPGQQCRILTQYLAGTQGAATLPLA